ncbi:hypothetical protein [Haloarcula sp. CGMCC 1.6347]|uniref:hypothetical protein n=1 Tax=Haloarcula sp. CGMCC 1.6347 TaxID=3111455 RepID=UPI00300E79CC
MIFEHLQEDKQAELLVYFDDLEQESLDAQNHDAQAFTENGQLKVSEVGYGWISSDTTCADLFNGGDSSGSQ